MSTGAACAARTFTRSTASLFVPSGSVLRRIRCAVAVHHQRTVYAITRPGGRAAQQLALRLGAVLLFARVGALVPQALKAVVKGGVVICGAIHMSDIPSFRFSLLWGERRMGSVGNPTCGDGLAFIRIAGETQLTL